MLKIEDPFHGAVVNHRWGIQTDASLTITVTGQCPAYGEVSVNGVPAAVASGRFTCDVEITAAEQDIKAIYDGSYGHQEHAIRVVWDRHSFPRYRFSIDDNSYWLRDVARNGYDALFDCFYLDMLRGFHREYGTKFTLNIYYATEDGFTLPEFPDRYRAEFEASADWLGLAFHARANDPDRLYQYAPVDELISDMEKVEEQVIRFAGEQSLIPPTVIHWGMIVPEAIPALYEKGVRVLSGFAHRVSYGYDVNYWLDDARSEYLYHNEALKDFDTGMVFSKVDIVCNNTPVDAVPQLLDPLYETPRQAEIMDFFTHEQYFWPFYKAYIPDHADRLNATFRWATDHGYKPIFFHEGLMGAPSSA